MTNKTPYERTPGVQHAGGTEKTGRNDPRTEREQDRSNAASPSRERQAPTKPKQNQGETDEFTGEPLDEEMVDATEEQNEGEPKGRTNGRSPQRGNASPSSAAQSGMKKKGDENCGCDANDETR